MKALKKSVEIVSVVIILLASMSGSGNFTQPVLPASKEQGANTVHSGSSYYGNDDENYFKKPPCQGGGTRFLQTSFWIVPILRYLVTVSGKGISLRDEPLTVLLPVVLESAANWWFHEQQLENQFSQSGEVIQGFPIPVNQWPLNQPSEKEKKPESREEKGATPDKRKQVASQASSVNDNKQSSGGGNGHEDQIKHDCGSHSCPACNYGPCLCPQCVEQLTLSKAFEEKHLKPRARVWSGRAIHIVQMLAYRQVTGHFPVPEAQLLSTLSQARIQRYRPAVTSEIPPAPGRDDYDWCVQLISLSGGRLLARTIEGHCYVWSERAGIWSFIRLEQFEFMDGSQLMSIVLNLVVLPDGRVAQIDWHRIDETSINRLNDIVLWTEQHNGWKFEVIASYYSKSRTAFNLRRLTCLAGGELLFLLYKQLWAMTEYDDQWSPIQLTSEYTEDVAALPDGRFITWQTPESQSQSGLGTLSVWTKTEGLWTASVIYRGDIIRWTHIVDARFNIDTGTNRIFFEEINDEWKQTSREIRPVLHQYATPDGRLAELSKRLGLLAINIEYGQGWLCNEIITGQLDELKCLEICSTDQQQLLSDGRVVTTIGDSHVQIWQEENGDWTSVNFQGNRLRYITRLIELPEFRLAVTYSCGAISILNLMPAVQELPPEKCSVSYTARACCLINVLEK